MSANTNSAAEQISNYTIIFYITMLTLDKDSMDVGTLNDGINCVISNPSNSSGDSNPWR